MFPAVETPTPSLDLNSSNKSHSRIRLSFYYALFYFILFFVKILSTILTLFRELFGTQAILSVKKTSTLILIRSLPVYWITSPLFLLYQNCVI